MTVVHLFRRYKRWNPVQPTYGAFWGLGIGFGCGVGWGPGFGPEVIGYVGAGCGLGFSVGVTFAGFGIGLPASGLINLPLSALSFVGSEMLYLTTKHAAPAVESVSKQGWETLSLHTPGVKHKFEEAVFWGHERVKAMSSFPWNKSSFLAADAANNSWQLISKCSAAWKQTIQRKGTLPVQCLDDVQTHLRDSSSTSASLSRSPLK